MNPKDRFNLTSKLLEHIYMEFEMQREEGVRRNYDIISPFKFILSFTEWEGAIRSLMISTNIIKPELLKLLQKDKDTAKGISDLYLSIKKGCNQLGEEKKLKIYSDNSIRWASNEEQIDAGYDPSEECFIEILSDASFANYAEKLYNFLSAIPQINKNTRSNNNLSFELTDKPRTAQNKISKIFKNLKKHQYINATLTQFKALFGLEGHTKPMTWESGTATELLYFLFLLEDSGLVKKAGKKYQILRHHFIKGDQTHFIENFKQLYSDIKQGYKIPKKFADIRSCFAS